MKFVPKSETTRRHIIESTAALFNKKGVLGTSVSDLEKATGLTRGSIYGNFENKEAVALAAFEYNWELKRKILFDGSDSQTNCEDKLLSHVLLHHPSAKTAFTPGGCPLQNTTMEADDTNDLLRSKAASALLSWTKELSEIIEKGVKNGEFKVDTDALGVSLQIIALIEGAALFARATRDMRLVNQLFDAAKKIIGEIRLS
ncbi:TetR/AcrR family transcriptional regulator [Mucilaginibacter sp. E4BP6]|uniref:TetR/AcrR family transcriptional regulator n=1 Tax=Mucilaginibacter sp. E4BP6 TaxID=2723089 RepID=UPI0015CCB906|nr:TetR/AcrR family transcriptional regulator [Mucilaginibacter sp. E4BP6]NYE67013.1 AcrR family transcriptional regulator [Mucilaginibacter sp. E4BP6]